MTDASGKTPVELTASIVSAYLSNNPTQASEIPNLISQVHAALLRVSSGRTDTPLEPAKPAVSVKKSISPEFLVCLEHGKRVGCQDLLRCAAGIQRQQDRDQAAHDMRVAIAEIVEVRFAAIAVDLLGEPDLAGAAVDLVGGGVLGLRHRIQRAAEFDDVAVAVVPLVQQRKIVPDFVDRRHRV